MWGFAEIVESNNHNLGVGERLFGYFPAADSVVLSPIKISDQSFSDGKAHSNSHNKYISGINALYLRITTQQTTQNIS